MVMDFFPMTKNSNVADFPAVVTFFPHSSPVYFLGYCCGGYNDALVVWLSSFPCDVVSFLVDPVAILLSAPSIVRTHAGVQPTNVGESFESVG